MKIILKKAMRLIVENKISISCSIMVFMYLFSFHFWRGRAIDSAMIVSIVLLFFAFRQQEYLKQIVRSFKTRHTRQLLICICVIFGWIFLCQLINQTWDLSFVKTYIHMIFQFVLGAVLYQFLIYNECEEKAITYVIWSFVAQTIIEWLAFLIPKFHELINITKSAETIRIGASYGGTRAVALAGSDFFGLSAAYAIVLLIYWSRYNMIFQNNRILKVVLYVFMMTGTFFAGRTGFIGVLFAVVYGFFVMIKKLILHEKICFKFNESEKKIGKIAIVLISFALVVLVVLYFVNENIHNLFAFALQPVFNLFENGSLRVSSVTKMFNMYFVVPVKTLAVGDGIYSAVDGGYYMNTDVGYMRVLLYMGIPGLLLMTVLQGMLMYTGAKRERMLKCVTFACLMILNIKGEVVAWSLIVQACVILFCLQGSKADGMECKELPV